MSEAIVYLRKRTTSTDRIIWDVKSQSYKNKHITTIKGYDNILNRWDKISEKTELQDVSKYPTNPSYEKELFVLIRRTALDSNTLKQITKYFKQRLIIKSSDKNIWLTMFQGKLFQNNFNEFGTPCQPLSMNALLGRYKSLFPHLKVEVSEPTPITDLEVQQLLEQDYPMVEESFVSPSGNLSDYKTMV